MSQRTAYFDCFSGASGDMILGALIDAGASPKRIAHGLARLTLPRWRWTIRRVMRGGFRGTRVEVAGASNHGSRGLLAATLRRAPALGPEVGGAGARILRRLLAAEGAAHGVRPEHAHLHEVEDLDTVVDVFGTLLALRALGVTRSSVSTLTAGTGTVTAHHGELPVPAPGTAELLRGSTVEFGRGAGELLTPTGAAILAELAAPGLPPPLTVERIGYGAGARETPGRPNLLRVFVGIASPAAAAEFIHQVEAVVDDMSPQLVEAFMDRAYREGALEAWSGPVVMKRSRPGFALTALAPADKLDGVIRAFLEETTTLGVRVSRRERITLARRMGHARTPYGPLLVKLAGAGASAHATPEYRDAVRLARKAGVPVRLVLDAARGGAFPAPRGRRTAHKR